MEDDIFSMRSATSLLLAPAKSAELEKGFAVSLAPEVVVELVADFICSAMP